MDETVAALRNDIRKGQTDDLRYWISQPPLPSVWSIILTTYATDIGCAPLATHVWKSYKKGTIVDAYDCAYTLSQQYKSKTTRYLTTILWKGQRIPEPAPLCELLGTLVGNLQSAYRYDWDPYLQFRTLVAASNISDPTQVWEQLLEISPILSRDILRNLAALRSMHKVTGHIEFLVLALVSITQPGEWEIPISPIIKPFVSPTWTQEVPEECHDILTNKGRRMLVSIAWNKKMTTHKAIMFGIRNYYNVSLAVSNERVNCTTTIYKQYAIAADLGFPDQEKLSLRLRTLSVLRKLPKRSKILELLGKK